MLTYVLVCSAINASYALKSLLFDQFSLHKALKILHFAFCILNFFVSLHR